MHRPRGWEGSGGTEGVVLAGKGWIHSGEGMGWQGKLRWHQALPGLRPSWMRVTRAHGWCRVAGDAPPVLAVTRTLCFSQQCVCPHELGLLSPSFLIQCHIFTVSTWGTCGQSRGCAKGAGIDQGGEEKLHSLQACSAPGLVLWEATEGKQSFPGHQSQRPSVSPKPLSGTVKDRC